MGYHDIHGADGSIAWTLAAFYFAAGVAFGLLYARRGGIGIHFGDH